MALIIEGRIVPLQKADPDAAFDGRVYLDDHGPVEEVVWGRDEMSNMVWGIERRIPLPSGMSKPGGEAAREYRDHLQRLVPGPGATPLVPAVPIRYQVMNAVPEQWIPFIPVHVPGSVREIQL